MRLRAWLIYAGLTLPIGLFGHVLFEQVGVVVRRFGDVELDHTILAACAAVVLLAAVLALRHGSHAERRRRLALLLATLPSGARLTLAGMLLQTLVAAGTLTLEGVAVDPARLGLALIAGVVGVLLGSFMFRAIDDDVLAFVAAIVLAVSGRGAHTRCVFATEPVSRYAYRVLRLHAGRAPPFASSFVISI